MRSFQIALARKVFRIQTFYDETYRLCSEYLVEPFQDVIDADLSISEADLESERERSEKRNGKGAFSSEYLETLAVYRKIAKVLPDLDAFIVHGAVFSLDEKAFLITGKSGTGKTTVTRRILKIFREAYVVNGDKPIMAFEDEKVLACGTPWSGKERMNCNCQVPLKAVFLLERGNDNEVEELRFSQAFPILLQQTYHPQDRESMKKTLDLLSRLGKSKVKFFRLSLKRYDTRDELEKNDEVTALLQKILSF